MIKLIKSNSLINVFALSVPLVAGAAQANVNPVNYVKHSNITCGADFSSGTYSYNLQEKIYETINTIEFTTRLGRVPDGQPGGPVISNYTQYNQGALAVDIDADKQVNLNWNGGEVKLVFDEYPIESDEWHTYAIVRDEEAKTFTLYVDGEMVQEYTGKSGNKLTQNDYHMVIGGDWKNWHEDCTTYFGEISYVSLYKTARTAQEIKEDYSHPENIDFEHRGMSLLFHTKLELNAEMSLDTSGYKNHARLKSNNYFYDGDLATCNDYTFAVIPDPQMLSNHRRDHIHFYGDYLLDIAEEQKLKALMCVGDNADCTGNWDLEMGATSGQLNRLDEVDAIHVTVPGNHDYDNNCTTDRNLTWYNKYYSEQKLSEYEWWGGCYKPNHTENSYYLFEQSGVKYLFICLEFGPDDNVLEWANNIVSSYPDRRVVVTTHAYLEADASLITAKNSQHAPTRYTWNAVPSVAPNDADVIYNSFIKKHSNIFLVFCGHIPADDIMMRQDIGEHGNVITSFLVNDQGLLSNDGDEALVGLFAFNEKTQEISINYVSCITGKLYNIQNQRTISFKGNTTLLSSQYYNADGSLK